MAKSLFREKVIKPDNEMILAVLNEAKLLWDELIMALEEAYPSFTQEWKYYGAAWGWSLVLKNKAKTLCYLTPGDGHFYVSIIFNDKGRLMAIGEALPEQVALAVAESRNNAKNIPYDFAVVRQTDLEVAHRLIAVRAKS